MEKPVTIGDVATAAGVSKSLVSFVLNNRPGVAPETRARVQRVAEEIGWRPNPVARGLSTGRAFALGLIVRRDPRIIEADPFFAAFIAGVEIVLSRRNQVLVLSAVGDQAAEETAYRTLTSDNRVDGFLITDLLDEDPRIELVAGLGKAAVTLGRPGQPSAFPVITRDYTRGIEDLVHHLAELGHSRIAHVAGDQAMQHGRDRQDRYSTAMESYGFEPQSRVTDFSAAQGAAATENLLDGPTPPTAIIYGNDPMAIAGMSVAHARGMRLPGDLSIAGMDGAEMGKYVYPALTTLNNDPAEWGVAAAGALLDLIENGTADDVVLPGARLIVRESTSPPA